MTSEHLELIQLARLPRLQVSRRPVPPGLLRRVLLAIAVETGNGQHPIPRDELARACDMERKSHAHLSRAVSALALIGVVKFGRRSALTAIGRRAAQVVEIDWQALRRLRREPLYRQHGTSDRSGATRLTAPAWLLQARDQACERLGVGIKLLGPIGPGVPPQECRRRLEARAAVARAIKAACAQRKVEIPDAHVAHLLGVDPTCLRYSLRATRSQEVQHAA